MGRMAGAARRLAERIGADRDPVTDDGDFALGAMIASAIAVPLWLLIAALIWWVA